MGGVVEFPTQPEPAYLPMGECRQIYIIGVDRAGPMKIGIADDSDMRRTNLQTGNPERLTVFVRFLVPPETAPLVEAAVHRSLSEWRMAGEWFAVPVETAMECIWYSLNSHGVRLPLQHEPQTRMSVMSEMAIRDQAQRSVPMPQRSTIAPPGECSYCDARRAVNARVARDRRKKATDNGS